MSSVSAPPHCARDSAPSLGERAFLGLQRVLPRRRLSALVYRLTRSRRVWLKDPLIRGFMALYAIRLDEAITQRARDFESFNEFFIRALKDGARPLPADPRAVISPADGRVVQAETLRGDTLLQAKRHEYTLAALLGGHALAPRYEQGLALTVYLAPSDYHRVHMPLDGVLRATTHVPGDRYSVNATTTAHLPGLFARNERVACHFDTAVGPMAVVLIGALNVGSISTVWAGEIAGGDRVEHRDAPAGGVRLARGDELGRFNMGSTVIVLLPAGAARLRETLTAGSRLRMGEPIADLLAPPADHPERS